tara:strand:- start:205 stop:825 length:621 start_codon:yes stop_codon:yes gene_type:complete
MYAKVCGVKDNKTLKFLINHRFPPKFIGFICNYNKSKRYLNFKKLENLIRKKKKNKIYFVSVLVNPDNIILNKIKNLDFDYLQLYDVSPTRTKIIKNKYKFKIITALTVQNIKDIVKFKNYENISEIILFDSKGYEKSLSFNYKLVKNVTGKFIKMLAGNIKYNDKLEKYNKITDIIDISGSLETNGNKDISKIDIFLNNINKVKK